MFRSGAHLELFRSKGLAFNPAELITPELCHLGFSHIISHAVICIIYHGDSKTFLRHIIFLGHLFTDSQPTASWRQQYQWLARKSEIRNVYICIFLMQFCHWKKRRQRESFVMKLFFPDSQEMSYLPFVLYRPQLGYFCFVPQIYFLFSFFMKMTLLLYS